MPVKKNETNQWGTNLADRLNFRKTSALEDGQSIIGTLLAFKESKIPNTGKVVTNLVMQDPNGEKFELSPSGNIVYAIKEGKLGVGTTYKFQKEGSTKIKGMVSGVFGIYPAVISISSSDI